MSDVNISRVELDFSEDLTRSGILNHPECVSHKGKFADMSEREVTIPGNIDTPDGFDVLKISIDFNTVSFALVKEGEPNKEIKIYSCTFNDLVKPASMRDAVITLTSNRVLVRTGTPPQVQRSDIARRGCHDQIATELKKHLDEKLPGFIRNFEEARNFAGILREIKASSPSP